MATVILLLLILYDKFGKHKRLFKLYFLIFVASPPSYRWPSLSHFKFQKWLTFQECHFVNFSKLSRAAMPFTEKAGWTFLLLSFPTSFQESLTFLVNLCSFSYFFWASLGAGVSGFPHCNKIFSSVPLWKVSQVLALVDLQYIITQWMNAIIFVSGSLETSDVSSPSTALGLWWLFLQIAPWSTEIGMENNLVAESEQS